MFIFLFKILFSKKFFHAKNVFSMYAKTTLVDPFWPNETLIDHFNIQNSGRKRFKCKCTDGKCKWSINIEETICKGKLGFIGDFVLWEWHFEFWFWAALNLVVMNLIKLIEPIN